MKLKAPPGVGDPCVAGVGIASRDGLYEVEAMVGALLIECFGFVEVEATETAVFVRPPEPMPWPVPLRRLGRRPPKDPD
jgi:hypothetical protein